MIVDITRAVDHWNIDPVEVGIWYIDPKAILVMQPDAKDRMADRPVREIVHAHCQRRVGLEDRLRTPSRVEQLDARKLGLARAAARAEPNRARVASVGLGLFAAIDVRQVSVDHLAGRADQLGLAVIEPDRTIA